MLAFYEMPMDRGEGHGCRRCHPSAVQTPDHRDEAEIIAALEVAVARRPARGVMLTGRDPLGHPRIDRVLDLLSAADVPRIGVRAPGERLEDSARVEALLASGIRIFEVPVLGSCAPVHDAIVGSPGSFDRAVGGLHAVFAAAEARGVRAAVRARVDVCQHNVQDLPATVMRLAEARVTSVLLACADERGSARFADWIAAACDTGTVNRVWVSVAGLSPEVLGEKALHATDVMTFTEVAQ